MEDWKKKYEETLRKAKEYYADVPGSREFLDNIFPELAESEDERIINAIIGILKNSNAIDINVSQEKMIDWLEKRKEQKPETMWTINDAKPGDILNSVRVQATIIYKGMADDGKHILAYCALQKGFFISQELTWDRDFEPASEYWKNALYDAMAVKGYKWDTDKLELKKIEQKPAEWSEEDEKIRRNLMSLLANMRGDRITEETYQKYYPWLNSLRPQPHWKPSEEQMLALGGCLDYLLESDNEDAEIIKSLINDLKKL